MMQPVRISPDDFSKLVPEISSFIINLSETVAGLYPEVLDEECFNSSPWDLFPELDDNNTVNIVLSFRSIQFYYDSVFSADGSPYILRLLDETETAYIGLHRLEALSFENQQLIILLTAHFVDLKKALVASRYRWFFSNCPDGPNGEILQGVSILTLSNDFYTLDIVFKGWRCEYVDYQQLSRKILQPVS
jgi:hypothetical protein